MRRRVPTAAIGVAAEIIAVRETMTAAIAALPATIAVIAVLPTIMVAIDGQQAIGVATVVQQTIMVATDGLAIAVAIAALPITMAATAGLLTITVATAALVTVRTVTAGRPTTMVAIAGLLTIMVVNDALVIVRTVTDALPTTMAATDALVTGRTIIVATGRGITPDAAMVRAIMAVAVMLIDARDAAISEMPIAMAAATSGVRIAVGIALVPITIQAGTMAGVIMATDTDRVEAMATGASATQSSTIIPAIIRSAGFMWISAGIFILTAISAIAMSFRKRSIAEAADIRKWRCYATMLGAMAISSRAAAGSIETTNAFDQFWSCQTNGHPSGARFHSVVRSPQFVPI